MKNYRTGSSETHVLKGNRKITGIYRCIERRTALYVITASKWYKDWEHHPYPVEMRFEGSTLTECMAQVNEERHQNNLSVFSPLTIDNVYSTSEI